MKGAEPVLADIDPDLIEDAVTSRTNAILPADAFGRSDGRDSGRARGRADAAHRRDRRQSRLLI
ncbi:MAG: DegT/DnrJ/EryC1/StrS family aminotransferase [Bacteroidota bacterium]